MRYFLFLTVLLTLLFAFSGTGRTGDAAPDIGKFAPQFELNDLYGKKVALSDFKGRVVFLSFWATWCAPCRSEMVSLNNLQLALKDKAFSVIAISVDSSDKTVRSFVSDKGIIFPVLMDKNKSTVSKYVVFGLPSSFLIDKRGVIVEKFRGDAELESPDTRNKILRLIESE